MFGKLLSYLRPAPATRLITIDVTKADIESGQQYRTQNCPIALATSRAAKADFLSVSPSGITFRFGQNWYVADLPSPARLFITSFDMGGRVSPMSFTVTAYKRKGS